MMNKLPFAPREVSLNGISTARRHLYFYTLLLLTSVVLSNMKDSLLGDPAATATKARHAAARVVGERAVQSLK